MKYKIGQTISLNDGCLKIDNIDENEIYATLMFPSHQGAYPEVDWYNYDGVPESTIDAIIAHHNRRGLK